MIWQYPALFIVVGFGVAAAKVMPRRFRWRSADYWTLLGVCALCGGGSVWISHSADQAVAEEKHRLLELGPAYVVAIQRRGHPQLNAHTSAEDPLYLDLVRYEIEWLRANPSISDIYTLKKDENGKIVFIVDSETDYNRNGRYDSEREVRTRIGEVYEKKIPELENAFAGQQDFTLSPYSDKWGNWVSAFFPLRNDRGELDGVLGIDFDSSVYSSRIAEARTRAFLWACILSLGTLAAIASIRRSSRRNQKLHKALLRADQAKKAKSEFFAKMSHELRTPLAAMLGMVTLLRDEELSAEGTRLVRILGNSGENLLGIINDILDFSKIESRGVPAEKIRFEPRAAVAEVVTLLSARAKDKGVELKIRIDDSVPEFILGNLTSFRQILMNLTANAIKFTPQGEVCVDGIAEARGPAAARLRFAVKDTGIGISESGRAQLFQSFQQVDDSSTKHFGGSGLGLAISKGLCESMGGEIGVESELGKGSTFWFAFEAERVEAPASIKSPPAPTSPPFEGTRLRILLAEDNSVNQLVATRFLQKLGLRDIDVARNGLEVLDMVALKRYDLILMDYQMPGMDGPEAARRIGQRFSSDRKPKIVALTAGVTEESRRVCMEAGMIDFLTKPLTISALSDVLTKHLPANDPDAQKDAA